MSAPVKNEKLLFLFAYRRVRMDKRFDKRSVYLGVEKMKVFYSPGTGLKM